ARRSAENSIAIPSAQRQQSRRTNALTRNEDAGIMQGFRLEKDPKVLFNIETNMARSHGGRAAMVTCPQARRERFGASPPCLCITTETPIKAATVWGGARIRSRV